MNENKMEATGSHQLPMMKEADFQHPVFEWRTRRPLKSTYPLTASSTSGASASIASFSAAVAELTAIAFISRLSLSCYVVLWGGGVLNSLYIMMVVCVRATHIYFKKFAVGYKRRSHL